MKSVFLQCMLALLLFIGSSVAYRLWYAMVSAKSAQAAELQNQIVAKESAVKQSIATRVILNTIATQQSSMQSYFVSESNIVGFISDLESQGQALGSTVTVRSVSTGTKGNNPTLVLALTVDGSFDSVMRTVGAIEYAPYDLTVSALSLSAVGKKSWHADMTIAVGSITGTVSTAGSTTPSVMNAAAAGNPRPTGAHSTVMGAQPL